MLGLARRIFLGQSGLVLLHHKQINLSMFRTPAIVDDKMRRPSTKRIK